MIDRKRFKAIQDALFNNPNLNPKVIEELPKLGVFDPKTASEKLGRYGIFTAEQLLPYIKDYSVQVTTLEDGVEIPIYTVPGDEEYFEIYEEYLKEDILNPDQLKRFCRRVSYNHQEVIALLTMQPQTLTEIQYHLRSSQSLDGVRGRVSELVDIGVVERYYFSLRSLNTGEVRSYAYHYLTGMRDSAQRWIQNRIDNSKMLERVYLGEQYRERIMKALSQRPVFVVELADIFGIPESKLLYMLRELSSSGEVNLFYQSILKDGKNGKFIAYLPGKEKQVKELYKELRHFFIETKSHRDFINKHKGDYMDYNSIVTELGISDSLCIAFLTNLRKRDIVEQEGTDVIFSAFKFI